MAAAWHQHLGHLALESNNAATVLNNLSRNMEIHMEDSHLMFQPTYRAVSCARAELGTTPYLALIRLELAIFASLPFHKSSNPSKGYDGIFMDLAGEAFPNKRVYEMHTDALRLCPNDRVVLYHVSTLNSRLMEYFPNPDILAKTFAMQERAYSLETRPWVKAEHRWTIDSRVYGSNPMSMSAEAFVANVEKLLPLIPAESLKGIRARLMCADKLGRRSSRSATLCYQALKLRFTAILPTQHQEVDNYFFDPSMVLLVKAEASKPVSSFLYDPLVPPFSATPTTRYSTWLREFQNANPKTSTGLPSAGTPGSFSTDPRNLQALSMEAWNSLRDSSLWNEAKFSEY